ncbi:MAG TPA: TetR/AcrR family transcriptional regulator [Methylovirgula sp.]|nr:TetR/AcrR family transcriptional regulator [Methylovirgula sp.]
MSTEGRQVAVSQPRRIPRGEKRREEIAAVAERVFLELGFTETTMQIVASRAGASKETLYRHFGSKEGLFSEVVRTKAERIYAGLEDESLPRGNPGEVLKQLGLNLLGKLLYDDPICLFRMLVAETPRTPELGRIFFEQGPAQVLRHVSTYLERATDQGILNCPEPELAARLFLGAVVGNRHIMLLVAPGAETLTEEKIQRHVDAAVAMFLARYAP